MTSFNDHAITSVINPLTNTYTAIFPEFIRLGVSNVFHNIQYPIRLTNNLLQGKFKNASEETGRFVINSTLGLAGIFDVATETMHIPRHDEDFGQTLGHYGIGAGFHVVLPFIGPSNLRDVVGLLADGYLSPTVYVANLHKYKIPQNYKQYIGLYGLDAINKNSHQIGAYEILKQDALELYPFLRDVYEQKRNTDIIK
jgi:phospholipid-binding lipoprotein MlaA